MQDKKAIYIVFSSTHCGIGSFIRFVTGGFYNHVSVSFDRELRELYSFARLYKRAPLYGGLVHESRLRYSGIIATPIKVCQITLSDEQFGRIRTTVDTMMRDRETYLYNLVSAILYPLHRRVRILRAYTCVEFATYLLSSVELLHSVNSDSFCSIENLELLLNDNVIFEGEFPQSDAECDWQDDMYNRKIGFFNAVLCTLRNNAKLVKRLLLGANGNSV